MTVIVGRPFRCPASRSVRVGGSSALRGAWCRGARTAGFARGLGLRCEVCWLRGADAEECGGGCAGTEVNLEQVLAGTVPSVRAYETFPSCSRTVYVMVYRKR